MDIWTHLSDKDMLRREERLYDEYVEHYRMIFTASPEILAEYLVHPNEYIREAAQHRHEQILDKTNRRSKV